MEAYHLDVRLVVGQLERGKNLVVAVPRVEVDEVLRVERIILASLVQVGVVHALDVFESQPLEPLLCLLLCCFDVLYRGYASDIAEGFLTWVLRLCHALGLAD